VRIILIGGGEIGLALSRALAQDHAIVVVDQDASVAERFAALDVQFETGSGTDPEVLRQAGIAQCQLFVASTGLDEVNVLACAIANKLASPTTICLVSREDLLKPLGGVDLLQHQFGIDRVLWPEAQLADDIQRLIAVPGALDAETFAQGRISLVEYRLAPDSRLTSAPLAALHLPPGVLVVAVRRSDRFLIPRGHTQLAADDKVFLMGRTDAIQNVHRQFVGAAKNGRQLVTIVGGGDVGLRIAAGLDRRDDIELRIIERDPTRGERIATMLKRALVLRGDGTDLELLESERIGRSDVLVSVIDNDERNLLASLLARQLGVKRIITRVSRPSNLRLFELVGIEMALSARGAAVAAIVHQVGGGKSQLLAVLEQGQAQVLEVTVPQGQPPTVIRRLRHLPESIIAAVLRGEDAMVPGGSDEIRAGDRLLVFTTAADVEAVRHYFSPSA
jgi:trk system potassium uptake protein TrkA